MKVKYDKEADACYISLNGKVIHKTITITEGCNLDLDENDNVVGIELLELSHNNINIDKAFVDDEPVGNTLEVEDYLSQYDILNVWFQSWLSRQVD